MNSAIDLNKIDKSTLIGLVQKEKKRRLNYANARTAMKGSSIVGLVPMLAPKLDSINGLSDRCAIIKNRISHLRDKLDRETQPGRRAFIESVIDKKQAQYDKLMNILNNKRDKVASKLENKRNPTKLDTYRANRLRSRMNKDILDI